MADQHRIDASTPKLDEFLRGGLPRPWRSPEERDRALDRAFERQEVEVPPEEFLPQRIMVMWRLARAAALVLGLAQRDQTLDEATEIRPDPWTETVRPLLSPTQQWLLRRTSAATLGSLYSDDGLPLLPPDDARLGRWCAAMALLARDLGLGRTERERQGLRGLLEPRSALYAGVTVEHILALEDMLIDQTQDLVVRQGGERVAITHLREQYGLTRKEATALVQLAKSVAQQEAGGDLEQNRVILESQLKDYAGRARETLNMADELRAYRELARVQGLTRSDPDDMSRDFVRIIAAVAERQDRVLDVSPQPKALPEAAEYQVIDEDEEAIAEYDREN